MAKCKSSFKKASANASNFMRKKGGKGKPGGFKSAQKGAFGKGKPGDEPTKDSPFAKKNPFGKGK